jgi:hypothetical protein
LWLARRTLHAQQQLFPGGVAQVNTTLGAQRQVPLNPIAVDVVEGGPWVNPSLPADGPAAVEMGRDLVAAHRDGVRAPSYPENGAGLIERTIIWRDLSNYQGETINCVDRGACTDEGDRWLHHAGSTQRQIDRLVGVLETDHLLAGIRDAEDNDTSGAAVGHPTHSLGQLSGARCFDLELDRAGLTAGDQLAECLFVHARRPFPGTPSGAVC